MKSSKKSAKNQKEQNPQAQQQQEHEAGMQNAHLITQIEQEEHQSTPLKDPIKELYQVQQTINNKMVELDQLNWQYYDKQEKLFLKTFINIMDRMSTELQIYKQKYDNIDQEIDQQPECVELCNKMRFYRDQCLFLNAELKKQEQELAQLHALNHERQLANKELRAQLLRQLKKQHQYSFRRNSLESRLNSGNPHMQYKDESNKSMSFQGKPLKLIDEKHTSFHLQEPRVRYSTTRMNHSYTIHIKTPDQLKKNRKKICSTTITSKQKGQLDIQLSAIDSVRKDRREKTARDRVRYYH